MIMPEFDLIDIWQKADEKASDHYVHIEKSVVKMAKAKSKDLLSKIKRNMLIEWLISIAIGIVFIIQLWNHDYRTEMIIAFLSLSLIVLWPYLSLLNKIKKSSDSNVLVGLKNYVQILNLFIKRLKLLIYIISPITLIGSYLLVVYSYGKSPVEVFIDNWIPLAFVFIIYILAHVFIGIIWYIPKLYGNPKKEIEKIIISIENG